MPCTTANGLQEPGASPRAPLKACCLNKGSEGGMASGPARSPGQCWMQSTGFRREAGAQMCDYALVVYDLLPSKFFITVIISHSV